MRPVKPALLCLLLLSFAVGCDKSVGDPCEGDCGDALACINGTCKTCEGTDRCQGYGMCKVAAGRCEVPVAAEADCKQPQGKERYNPCEQDGKCRLDKGVCWAKTDEDCKNSKGCKDNGACTAKAGRCIPEKPDDCHGSKVCLELAHCTVQNGHCALVSSADCAKSQGCLSKGLCTLRDKNCMVGGSDDCKASSMCKIHGACTARDGQCQP